MFLCVIEIQLPSAFLLLKSRFNALDASINIFKANEYAGI